MPTVHLDARHASFLLFTIAMSVVFPAGASHSPTAPQNGSSFDPHSVPVYVAAMELHAVLKPADRLPDPKPRPGASASLPTKSIYTEEESPTKLSRSITQTVQGSLLQALAKIGYKAQPETIGARPARGVEVRGVFAEPDDLNRIRRAILGAGSRNPKLSLYIAVVNLSKPEQPFYRQVPPSSAVPQATDSRYGPIITLSAYAPLAKIDLPRNPSSDDLDKAAETLASQIDALIRANALAVADH